MKFLKWLDAHLEESLLILLLIAIVCVSFIQVIIRKLPWIPALTWAEEFCRYCLVWSVFLSLPYTIRKSSMMRVTVIRDLLPHTIWQLLNLFIDFITAVCMGILGFYSITVVKNIYASSEHSPAMLWPMWAVYSIMLLAFLLAFIRGVRKFIYHIRHFSDRQDTMAESLMKEALKEANLTNGGNGL